MNECKNNCPDCKCKESNPERRKFLGLAVGIINGIVGIAVIGPVIGFIGAPLFKRVKGRWVSVLPVAELAKDKTVEASFPVTVKDGYRTITRTYSVYLRHSEGKIFAFDPTCTHLGCRVKFQDSKGRYFCPCHGGVFDADGNVVSGPPPKPLNQYQTRVKDGMVWVYREV